MISKKIELKKLWQPKVEGVKNSKNQTIKHYESMFPKTKKNLVCCFVAIKVQI
jgi:hypothetical protein